MNKFAIPTILLTTVMVAGMFAFMPVEQASTVHTTGTIVVPSSVTIISADPVSTSFSGAAGSEFHRIILESTVPFTIDDIEIKGTLAGTLPDAGDQIEINRVYGFPAEYDSDVAGTTLAITTDSAQQSLDQNASFSVIEGDWGIDTGTYSLSANEISDDAGQRTFGPNTKIVVEIQMIEDDNDTGVATATVTFYLSGAQAANITINEFEDQNQLIT